jgi:hypothetical protein
MQTWALITRSAELGNVGASNESTTGACQHDGTDRRLCKRAREAIKETLPNAARKRIYRRIINGEKCDLATLLVMNGAL